WLVIGGGGSWQAGETGEFDAAALGWADLARPIAILPTAGMSATEGDDLLEYFIDLGGPNGSLVPIYNTADAQQEENWEQLAEAGLIVIPDGPDPLALLQALRDGPAAEAMAQAFDWGAVVLGVGSAGAALGAWVAGDRRGGAAERGLAWLQDVVVEPHFEGAESAERLQSVLHEHPESLGIGVPRGVALALGPRGEVETVGPGDVTVVVEAQTEDED
ncbi:MAG: hypothetical protein E3J64_04400, partial [Anaerolineales bacterium]